MTPDMERDTIRIAKLMAVNYEATGFLPFGAVQEAVAEGRVYHQHENGEWVGYLIRGPIRPFRPCHVTQEAIDKDARRLGSGRRCFERLLADARRGYASCIRLRCATDLPANCFWQALGFAVIGIDRTPNKRKRPVLVYELPLLPTLWSSNGVRVRDILGRNGQ